jgi:MSHA biogenesis protein MshN
MSIINKMLQDLDRRQGRNDPEALGDMAQVRSVSAPRKDREWFWRIIAVLMIAAVGWVAWIAWQLQPRPPVATEQALKAAQTAPRSITPAATAPAPAPVAAPSATTAVAPVPADAASAPAPAPAPAPAVVAQAPVPAAPPPSTAVAAPEPKRALAKPAAAAPAVETPMGAAAPSATAATKPAAGKLGLDVPPARVLEAPAQSAGRVQKVDRTRSADDRAEGEFRRGATLLNQGRVSEAEESFAAALAISPAHEGARQALIALYLENRRIDEARRLLQEGLALNPANLQFAMVLARVHAERRDYAAAFDVMNSVRGRVQSSAEFQLLLGTVLQRLNRHPEAAEAFRVGLRATPDNGPGWAGLGISLEAQGQRAEAIEAYKRVLSLVPPGSELNKLAELRLRNLR